MERFTKIGRIWRALSVGLWTALPIDCLAERSVAPAICSDTDQAMAANTSSRCLTWQRRNKMMIETIIHAGEKFAIIVYTDYQVQGSMYYRLR